MLDFPLPLRPVMALNFSSKPGTTTLEAAQAQMDGGGGACRRAGFDTP